MVFAAEEGQNEADQTPKPGKKVAVNKREKPARKKSMDRELTVSGHPLSVRLLP